MLDGSVYVGQMKEINLNGKITMIRHGEGTSTWP